MPSISCRRGRYHPPARRSNADLPCDEPSGLSPRTTLSKCFFGPNLAEPPSRVFFRLRPGRHTFLTLSFSDRFLPDPPSKGGFSGSTPVDTFEGCYGPQRDGRRPDRRFHACSMHRPRLSSGHARRASGVPEASRARRP
jgi:hypothetical protein